MWSVMLKFSISAVLSLTRLWVWQLKEAKGKNERKAALGAVDKASEQVEKYKKKLEETSKIGRPKIEVGCLEEVITKMESDTKGDWSEVMFIPAGTLASPEPAGK